MASAPRRTLSKVVIVVSVLSSVDAIGTSANNARAKACALARLKFCRYYLALCRLDHLKLHGCWRVSRPEADREADERGSRWNLGQSERSGGHDACARCAWRCRVQVRGPDREPWS